MTKELKKARDRVLVDNTAQAVFKHLDRIEDNREVLGVRWIWELLQNARDAAGPEGVRIRAGVSVSELRFEHDGKAFASKEIAHLVYHGSTKTEDVEEIGQFGSGFLATHLLSRMVRVAGRLEDSSGFEFRLDRRGESAEDLHQAMDQSWDAFEQSVECAKPAPNANTSFTYEFSEAGARELADAGLKELRQSGPLALAFCPEIKEIEVATPDAKWTLSRGSQGEGGVLTMQDVTEEGELSRSVAVVGAEGECCAALQLRPCESGLEIDHTQQVSPKLFVLFPLIGSERLGLPATINSRGFKPREDRDGIVLAGDSMGAQQNRRLLEDSMQLQERLLEWCAQERWSGTERMLAFDVSRLPDWASDDQWFRSLVSSLARKARKTPLMTTIDERWIEPRKAWVPTVDNSSHRDRLWTLMSVWEGAEGVLPRRVDLEAWSRNLSHWRALLDRSCEEMEEALTLSKVSRQVAHSESVQGLQLKLTNADGLPWLVSLLDLIRDADQTALLDEFELLPSQAGTLCKRSELRRDVDISEELKDIGDAFGLAVREKLLHKQAELDGQEDFLGPEHETELLDRLVAKVKAACQEGVIERQLVPWVARLFKWMVDRQHHIERLEGFPVPTEEERDNGVVVTHLERGCEAQVRPLAPVATWPEAGRRFGSQFHKRRILSKCFSDGDPELWQRLSAWGYVNASPLVKMKRVVEAFLPDEPLPEGDGTGSHKSTEEIEVSDIAFFVESDGGLIDNARKSRRRATELIRFIVEFAVEIDERAFEECSVECECGDNHKTYRAAWLAPLRRRRWVPLDASGRRGTTASAESLAALLADSRETASILLGGKGEQLLGALGVSRADLALRVVAGDENERLVLIRSMQDLAEATGDINRVRELAADIREHPEIVDTIQEQKVRRQKVQRNQEIGGLVEDLLRQEMEACGLTVRRTGIGSDFEVESDFVENEKEMWLELSGHRGSTLIEVKSTRSDQVKMTPVQAKHACSLGDGFALCVVPVDDEVPTRETVRAGLRVAFGVGSHLGTALTDYEFVREAEDVAREPQGAVELEIIGGQARFRIGQAIWGDGLMFEHAVERLRNQG